MAKKDKGKAKKPKIMKQKVKKSLKKTFFEVSAPITSTKIHLYAPSPESLDGKSIKLDLTKSLRGKSLELKLKIKNKSDKLIAEPTSLNLAGSYIRRVMRKGVDYCEDSFFAETKDYNVLIKPFFISRKRVSRTVLRALRENSKKFLLSHLKTREANELISNIMTNKLQKSLSIKLKKVYPLALCEIRVFELIKPLDKKSKEETKKKDKEEKPTKEEVNEDNKDLASPQGVDEARGSLSTAASRRGTRKVEQKLTKIDSSSKDEGEKSPEKKDSNKEL
jgi:ribosomal protein S3AE